MAKEVILTPVAVKDFQNIIDYLNYKWGIAVVNNFIDRFEEVSLSENPEIFPTIDRIKQIRKCVVTKHNTLYFKEYADVIRILTIFDTRQDPEKLTFIF